MKHRSLLIQPISIHKWSVEWSFSSEMEQVEWNFPDANTTFNSLLTGKRELSAITTSLILHLLPRSH